MTLEGVRILGCRGRKGLGFRMSESLERLGLGQDSSSGEERAGNLDSYRSYVSKRKDRGPGLLSLMEEEAEGRDNWV